MAANTKLQQAHADGFVSGVEAAQIVGTTYRRIDYAARTGTASPTHAADGSGTLRRYDLDALVRLKIVADLYDLGITIRQRPELTSMLDRFDEGPVALRRRLRVRLGSVTVTVDPQQARDAVEPAYHAVVDGGR